MAIFGNNSLSSLSSDTGWAGFKCCDNFDLTEDGTVSKLTAYLSNDLEAHEACYALGAIYYDSGGSPGARAAISSGAFMADMQEAGWVDLTLTSPIALSAGTYWLALRGDADSGGLTVYFQTTGTSYYNADVSGTFPDPWGTALPLTRTLVVYATYETGVFSPVPTFRIA